MILPNGDFFNEDGATEVITRNGDGTINYITWTRDSGASVRETWNYVNGLFAGTTTAKIS